MAYILDAIILVIFLVSLWYGHRRGFIKTLSKLIAFVLAIIIAFSFSSALAGMVYDTALAPSIQKSLTDNMTAAGNTIENGLDNAIDALPDFVRNALVNQGAADGNALLDKAAGEKDAESIAQALTAGTIRTAVMLPLRVLCFLVLYLVVTVLALVLLRLLDRVFKLPLLKQMNGMLGLVAGAVSGLLWVLIAVSVLQMIAATSASTALINQALLDQTHLVRFLISFNPFGGALRDVMATVAK